MTALPPCEVCKLRRVIMMVMKPGPDGVPWQLCSVCWRDGARPYKLGTIPAQYRDAAPAAAPAVGKKRARQ